MHLTYTKRAFSFLVVCWAFLHRWISDFKAFFGWRSLFRQLFTCVFFGVFSCPLEKLGKCLKKTSRLRFEKKNLNFSGNIWPQCFFYKKNTKTLERTPVITPHKCSSVSKNPSVFVKRTYKAPFTHWMPKECSRLGHSKKNVYHVIFHNGILGQHMALYAYLVGYINAFHWRYTLDFCTSDRRLEGCILMHL